MADSINPWISAYLISIAEEYGGTLVNVPVKPKKKVQLVEVSLSMSDLKRAVEPGYSF